MTVISAARLRIERAGRAFEAARPQPAQRAPDPYPIQPFRLGSPNPPVTDDGEPLPHPLPKIVRREEPPPSNADINEPPPKGLPVDPFNWAVMTPLQRASRVRAVQSALHNYAPRAVPLTGPLAEIVYIVSRQYNIDHRVMMGVSRANEVVRPRQVALFLAVELTGYATFRIGKLTGRDHTTIIAACKRVTNRLTKEPDLAGTLDSIRRQFREWRDREL